MQWDLALDNLSTFSKIAVCCSLSSGGLPSNWEKFSGHKLDIAAVIIIGDHPFSTSTRRKRPCEPIFLSLVFDFLNTCERRPLYGVCQGYQGHTKQRVSGRATCAAYTEGCPNCRLVSSVHRDDWYSILDARVTSPRNMGLRGLLSQEFAPHYIFFRSASIPHHAGGVCTGRGMCDQRVHPCRTQKRIGLAFRSASCS